VVDFAGDVDKKNKSYKEVLGDKVSRRRP